MKWISKNNANAIRGFAAIGIMFTHLGHTIADATNNILLFSSIGYLCVGIFFFYTGYNLLATVNKNGLKLFVYKKIKRIYIPFALSNVLYIIFQSMNIDYSASVRGVIYSIIGLRLINDTLWYVISILWFQVIFYVLYGLNIFILKRISGNNKYVSLIILCITLILYSLTYTKVAEITGAIHGWNEIFPLCIVVGVLVYTFEDKLVNIVFKNKVELMMLFLTALCICHANLIRGNEFIVGSVNLYDCLAPVLCALFVNMIICNEDVQGRVIGFIGTISYEIYLLHMVVLLFLRSNLLYINNDAIYVVVYTITLIVLSYLFNRLNNGLSIVLDKSIGKIWKI